MHQDPALLAGGDMTAEKCSLLGYTLGKATFTLIISAQGEKVRGIRVF